MDLSAVDDLITDLNTDGLEWYSAVTQKPSSAFNPALANAQAVAAANPAVAIASGTPMTTWIIIGVAIVAIVYLLRK